MLVPQAFEVGGVSQRVVWSVEHDQLSWLEGGPSSPIAARVFLRASASGDAAAAEISVVAMGPARELELINARSLPLVVGLVVEELRCFVEAVVEVAGGHVAGSLREKGRRRQLLSRCGVA